MSDSDVGTAVAEVIEAEIMVMDGGEMSLSAPDRVAVETAKAHPRSLEAFKKTLYELATVDQQSAESMFYCLKRGYSVIEGPSARFAECVLYAFGNVQVFGRIVDTGATTVVAEAAAWDMEKNTRIGKRVSRRITDRNGNRYNDDMISVTSNAAISIAVRNVILASVPRPLYTSAYNAALETASGDSKTFTQRRKEWTVWWEEQGSTAEVMWDWLDVKGPDDIGGFELRRLLGLKNAIKEHHTTFQRELDQMKGGNSAEEEASRLDAMLIADDG